MKKQEKVKTPLTQSKNIGYRVGMALLSVFVPIATYFSDLLYTVWYSEAFRFLSKLQGIEDSGETEMSLSIHRFVKEILPSMQGEGGLSKEQLWTNLSTIRVEVICSVLFLALTVLLAVVIFFVACFSKNMKIGTALSGVGLLTTIGFATSIHYLGAKLVTGTVSLASLAPQSVAAKLISMAARLRVFKVSTAFYLLLFLFVAMLCWGIANIVVAYGEKNAKADAKPEQKKAKQK